MRASVLPAAVMTSMQPMGKPAFWHLERVHRRPFPIFDQVAAREETLHVHSVKHVESQTFHVVHNKSPWTMQVWLAPGDTARHLGSSR